MFKVEANSKHAAIKMQARDKQNSSFRNIFAKIVVIGSILLIIVTATLGAYLIFSPALAAPTLKKNSAVTSKQRLNKRPVTIGSKYQTEVTDLGQKYMRALIKQQYDVMWSMLHPDVQASWLNKEAFASYLKKRFQGFTLQSSTVGEVNVSSYWVNPETMVRYEHVESMPISLQLVPQGAQSQQQRLPDQHASNLLQDLPFVVQHATFGVNKGNQWFILAGGPADPEAPILPPMTTIDTSIKVPILMYHYISGVPANDPNPTLRASLSVSPTTFNQQMDYLKEQGYHTITFNQLLNALYYQVTLPTKPIILTFDDGYADAYTDAYPILRAHGYSGMFYIITGKVNSDGQATWEQLREMLTNGMQMGSHTVHHVNLGATYQASASEAQQELQVSQEDMQTHLGIIIQHFCYPNGDPFKGKNVALQQEIVALLATLGYIDATTDPGPTGIIQRSLTPFVLLRLRIDGRSTLNFYKKLVTVEM